MKKNFLYLSFFAAAFLVSCKSNEAETPKEEVVTEEVITEEVVEEPAPSETPVEEKKEETKKAPAKKEDKTIVLKTEEQTKKPSTLGAKEMKQAKEISKDVEEVKSESTTRKSSVLKAKEEKDKAAAAAGGN